MNEEDVRALVNYRLEEAHEALKDADCLMAAGRSRQGIANRLYYAMFYAALALLQSAGKIPTKHAGVITLVDTEYVLKGKLPKSLSKAFHRAFEIRQTSDYHVMAEVSESTLRELRWEAEEFVSAVQSLFFQ